MEIKKKYPLFKLNSFHVKVDAKYYVEVASLSDIEEVRKFAKNTKMPFLIMGGGSNILFTRDFDGLIIKNAIKGIDILNEDEDHVFVKANAGENWDKFVAFCIDHNLGGLENLSLIPGNVGTSPIQNIGAYGVEMKDHFYKLEAIDWDTGEKRKFNFEQCQFGYRDSIFKNRLKGKVIITSVAFRLDKKHSLNIDYGDIRKEMENLEAGELSIRKVREAVCNIRQRKLPDPDEIGNGGSFFKNPVIKVDQYSALINNFPELVSYPLDEDHYKLAAGWLIDQCGWKGYRDGDAGVHVKQALVLVNHGNASGVEILNLANRIKDSVFEKFGVQIETEVNIY